MTTISENQSFRPQGPGAYQTGAPTPPPPPAPGKERNTIGLVALVVAVLGFIFAVWEGAYLLGWILLPIAFVLSLVAMFHKGRPKKMAVAALIISIVGTIAGGVAFVSSAAKAIDEAFADQTTVSEPADVEVDVDEADVVTEDPAEEELVQEGAASGESGTRDNPAALGSTVSGDDWAVTVNSFTADATAEVLAENQFNEEPDEGFVYALVNVTVRRLGAESGYPMEIDVAYVTEGGNVVNSYDAMVVVPDDLSSTNELYEGAEATGNVVLMIPEGDVGAIRVSPGIFADETFVATA